MGHKVNNREVVLVQTVYDRLSPKYRYATFGFEAENGNPCVSIGINDDGNRAVVWISLQDFSDVAALLDEIRYQNDRNFSKPLD